jgi:predicted MPP superfamily phosphohydrolase
VLSRRAFLRTAGTSLGAAAAVGLYTWRVEPRWLEIVHRPLPIRRLPAAWASRTLAHISDVHVGPRVDDEYVIATFDRVSQLRPDIVVMTGDFLSYHPGVFEHLPNVYRHFPRGRAATLAVLGNHDYGINWAQPRVAQQAIDILKPFGIDVLRNAIRDVDGLQIAGLDDWWAKHFDAASVLPRLESTRAALVLSHNPDTLDLPVWSDYEGWILCGHTHGGQCKPPFLPPPLLPVRNRRYTAGEFALTGNRRVYINRGVGHLLHVRFNVRPEVTMFELSSE